MTSTLGINDIQPRNLEAPRSAELLPDQIRVTAENFITLLTEYYKFMNINEFATVATASSSVLVGKSGSGPSNVISSILSQLDINEVDSDYLPHIQNAVAPYVPIPTYMMPNSTIGNPAEFYKFLSPAELASLRAQLYQKIIKYFYNTRGSRNSTKTFFHLFYNDTAGIYDANDYESTVQSYILTWLTSSGMAISTTTVSSKVYVGNQSITGPTPIQAWTPFTYVITTAIDPTIFDVPYRALVHPVGFKYVVQPTIPTNDNIYVGGNRMVDARYDYQTLLWFLDPTSLYEFLSFTVGDASAEYNEANQNFSNYTYADWSNFGMIGKFDVRTLSTASSGAYTLSIGTYSILNIVSGMTVTGTSSFGTTSSTMVSYDSSSINTGSGTVTLATPLSSTLSSGSTITFYVDTGVHS